MKLTNFYIGSDVHVGVIDGDMVIDITKECGSMEKIIETGQDGLKSANEAVKFGNKLSLDSITYAPMVMNPGKILCVGLNYMSHATEEKEALPKFPDCFNKFNNTIAANNENIPMPSAGGQFDYEAELVVIIGKEAKNVSYDDAYNYVFGYTCGNDVSSRQEQFRVTQWMTGKTSDKFGPTGPCIVTQDSIDASNLDIKCYCNGELRQSDNTRNLLFNIPHLISYWSQYVTLKPGDMIFTGTCAGCITGIVDENGNHPWLKDGDEVIVEIEGIGKLRNVMVNA